MCRSLTGSVSALVLAELRDVDANAIEMIVEFFQVNAMPGSIMPVLLQSCVFNFQLSVLARKSFVFG
jgi:hypothetical protein